MKKLIQYFPAILLILILITSSCTDRKTASRTEINEGLKQMYLSHLDKATQHFEKAIEWDETNAEPYLYLGRVMLNKSKIDSALVFVDKALALNPNYGEAYRTKAQIKTIQGNKDQACENYKKAKENGIKNLNNYLKFCN